MIARVLESALGVLWRREVLVPSAAGTLVSFSGYRWLGTDEGLAHLSVPSLWMLGLLVSTRFWLGLSISMTAVDILRAHGRWRPFRLLAPFRALQAAAVSIVLVLPIMAGALFLIVPGVFLALRWSQVAMLIADGRTEWNESLEASTVLVHGRKLEVLAIWLFVGVALALAAGTGAFAGAVATAAGLPAVAADGVSVLLRVVTDVFSLTLVGGIYYELDRVHE